MKLELLHNRENPCDMFRKSPAGLAAVLGEGTYSGVSIPGLPAKPLEHELPGFLQRLICSDLHTKT